MQVLERPPAIIYPGPHSTLRYTQLPLPFNGELLAGWTELDSLGGEPSPNLPLITSI